MKSSNQAYISIVVTGRNDNYGGDFYDRLQNQVSWTASLAKKFEVPVEYVLVNYNPIEDRPSLLKELDWPKENPFFQLKIVTVPGSVHETLIDPSIRKTVPLFEFIAKNAGIRQASADYILTTNADIIFDPGIFRFLSNRPLRKGVLYRTDRLDYRKSDSASSAKPEAFFKAVRSQIFRFFLMGNTYDWEAKISPALKMLWLKNYNRTRLAWRFFLNELDRIWIPMGWGSWHIPPETFYHCNASGDFILMHRDHYHDLRGFTEDTYISTHTDAIMVTKAKFLGLMIKLIPWPVYHQDHERRFKFDTPMGDENMQAMYKRLQSVIKIMQKEAKAHITNSEDWGLHKFTLPINSEDSE